MKNNNKPYRECPRFEKCNTNNCPLDKFYPQRSMDTEDKEQRCTMEKNVRLRIAEKFPGVLKYAGYSQREFSAKLAYDHLTPEQKEQKRIQARNMSLSRLVVNEPCV